MKTSKIALVLLALITASQSFALTYDCEKNNDSDAYSRVSLNENGEFSVQFYEYFSDIPANLVSTQSASTYNDPIGTHLTIVNNVIAEFAVEGETGKALTTALFVYNPVQKAGRLTFIQGGRSMARNELYTDCK